MPKRKVVDMSEDKKIERMVREIFARRANGELQKDIGKNLGLAQWEVSQIIHRKKHANVTIGHDVLMKVQEKFRKSEPRRKQPKQIDGSTISVPQAISDYTVAAANFVTAERRAKTAGLNQDTLDMIRVAIRENT